MYFITQRQVRTASLALLNEHTERLPILYMADLGVDVVAALSKRLELLQPDLLIVFARRLSA